MESSGTTLAVATRYQSVVNGYLVEKHFLNATKIEISSLAKVEVILDSL